MFILFVITDTALKGLAIKTRACNQNNKITAPLFCTIRRGFFSSYVTSFLYDVISLFYTKCHKDPFLIGAIN